MPDKVSFRELLVELETRVKDDADREMWTATHLRNQLRAVYTIRDILHRNGLLDKETKRNAL